MSLIRAKGSFHVRFDVGLPCPATVVKHANSCVIGGTLHGDNPLQAGPQVQRMDNQVNLECVDPLESMFVASSTVSIAYLNERVPYLSNGMWGKCHLWLRNRLAETLNKYLYRARCEVRSTLVPPIPQRAGPGLRVDLPES